MKAHTGVVLQLQSYSTAVDGGKWSVPRAGHFTPQERASWFLSALSWFFFFFFNSRYALQYNCLGLSAVNTYILVVN